MEVLKKNPDPIQRTGSGFICYLTKLSSLHHAGHTTHAAHTTHATHTTSCSRAVIMFFLLFWKIGNHSFSSQQQS